MELNASEQSILRNRRWFQMVLIRRKKKICHKTFWKHLKYFCQETTTHGLKIVGMPNLHPLERSLWLIMVGFAATGAISLTISNWNRFTANPTVVSIEKDYRNWQNHIPAITGCFNDKVDSEKAEKYIYKKWKTKLGNPKYDYYLDFVKLVANPSYDTFYQFEKFKNDVDLLEVDMAQLALNVHPRITGSLVTVDKSRKFKLNVILIELGICFTFFSKFAQLLTIKNEEYPNETEIFDDNNLLHCHYLNGLCYARFDSDPTLPLKYYAHSYMEIPDISTRQYHELGKGSDVEINYRMIETLASPNIKYLAPSQRKCRFTDEPIRKDIPVYSINLCRMACRYNLAVAVCRCKPYFYHIFGGIPCNITGLLCISQYSKYIAKTVKMDCKCPETCHLINYIPETPKIIVWQGGAYFDQRTTFRWGLLHPTTKYRRNILFGFGDLIVSFGGTLNLFLGISFISIIESIFLVCESIIHEIKKKLNRKKQSRKLNQMRILSEIHTFYN